MRAQCFLSNGNNAETTMQRGAPSRRREKRMDDGSRLNLGCGTPESCLVKSQAKGIPVRFYPISTHSLLYS